MTLKEHSSLSPSSADKWMQCYGWLRATEHLPNPTSVYAELGTTAHSHLETALRLGLPPIDVTDDIDIAMNLSTVTDWLADYQTVHPQSDYLIEHRLYWGKPLGYPELSGTTDLALVDPEELVIGDYKNGVQLVEVTDNKQLMLYLLGLIHKVGRRKKYRIVIFQPRARHEDGPVRECIITEEELTEFVKEVKHAIKENFRGGKRKAGEACHYCTAAGTCKTLAEYALEIAGEEFT